MEHNAKFLFCLAQVRSFHVSTAVRPQCAPWENDSTWTWQRSSWIRSSMSWWKQVCTRSPQNSMTGSSTSLMAFYNKRCTWQLTRGQYRSVKMVKETLITMRSVSSSGFLHWAWRYHVKIGYRFQELICWACKSYQPFSSWMVEGECGKNAFIAKLAQSFFTLNKDDGLSVTSF